MNNKSIKYRDTYAAPGSQLYQALVDDDKAKAAAIYEQCEKDRARLEGRCTKCGKTWEQHDFGVPEPDCP
jgi:hypothetical protein